MLTTPQRNQLLQIARESIEAVLAGRPLVLPAPEQLDEALTQPSGCFVTLHAHGALRGCIGTIQAMAPLYQAVSSSAISAAFRDPRFFALTADELPSIDLEISVMSPIVPVHDVAEIEVGRDGLIVTRGRNAGLLLPQVATEYGWDRDTFLSQTCQKAGLPQDAWRSPDTRIERFSAEVFSEQPSE
jgi:AmmeMemoRadiSam system protein A